MWDGLKSSSSFTVRKSVATQYLPYDCNPGIFWTQQKKSLMNISWFNDWGAAFQHYPTLYQPDMYPYQCQQEHPVSGLCFLIFWWAKLSVCPSWHLSFNFHCLNGKPTASLWRRCGFLTPLVLPVLFITLVLFFLALFWQFLLHNWCLFD